ncbi:MAG: DUF4190 domain-containing protein [Victivallales bacterium]
MATFEAKCPLCGAGFQAEEEWIGQNGECPGCGRKIKIQALQANLAPQIKLTIEKTDVAKSSALAITSLTLGILSLTCGGPFLGIPAIVLGMIAMGRIKKGTGSGKSLAISGIATGSMGTVVIGIALIVGILLAIINPSRENARRVSCIRNLKEIALAVRMYSQEYNEQFPHKSGAEGLEMLRSGGYLENTKMYTCPSTKTVPAREGEKLTEDNVDYVYVGGYNESVSPDTAIAYDKPNNHTMYGNIAFADGHVGDFAGANWMDNIKK